MSRRQHCLASCPCDGARELCLLQPCALGPAELATMPESAREPTPLPPQPSGFDHARPLAVVLEPACPPALGLPSLLPSGARELNPLPPQPPDRGGARELNPLPPQPPGGAPASLFVSGGPLAPACPLPGGARELSPLPPHPPGPVGAREPIPLPPQRFDLEHSRTLVAYVKKSKVRLASVPRSQLAKDRRHPSDCNAAPKLHVKLALRHALWSCSPRLSPPMTSCAQQQQSPPPFCNKSGSTSALHSQRSGNSPLAPTFANALE